MRTAIPVLTALLLACSGNAQKTAQDPVQARIQDLQERLERRGDAAARTRYLMSRSGDTGSDRSRAVEILLGREPGAIARLWREIDRTSSARVRRTALGALLRAGAEPGAVVRRASADRSKRVWRHVASVARELNRSEEVVELLSPDLESADPRDRRRAADALAELGDPRAIPALRAADDAGGCRKRPSAGGLRAHVAVVTQTRFVGRYRTEIA